MTNQYEIGNDRLRADFHAAGFPAVASAAGERRGAVIAVCVGHARTGDLGAGAVDGTSEYVYNCQLAERVSLLLGRAGVAHDVYARYPAATYASAMKWLAAELRKDGATLAVELHFNSSGTRAAAGHEWLYWQGSVQGKQLAGWFHAHMKTQFPKALARGVKSIGPKDNGAGFLRAMPCPACIAEPFFGSNAHDWQHVGGDEPKLAKVIAHGLMDMWRKMGGAG